MIPKKNISIQEKAQDSTSYLEDTKHTESSKREQDKDVSNYLSVTSSSMSSSSQSSYHEEWELPLETSSSSSDILNSSDVTISSSGNYHHSCLNTSDLNSPNQKALIDYTSKSSKLYTLRSSPGAQKLKQEMASMEFSSSSRDSSLDLHDTNSFVVSDSDHNSSNITTT